MPKSARQQPPFDTGPVRTFVFALKGDLAAWTAISIYSGSWCYLSLPRRAELCAISSWASFPQVGLRGSRLGRSPSSGAASSSFHHFIRRISDPLILGLDAAGLALFAVSGAGKALAYEIHPLIAVLMGGITGVGGGTIRDVLLRQVLFFFARMYTEQRLSQAL